MESQNILEILPPEVLFLVFSNLEHEDTMSSLSVSKLWHALYNRFNWKGPFLMTFGELSSTSVDLSRDFNWRKLFFDRKTLSVMARRHKVKLLLKSRYVSQLLIKALTRDNVICTCRDERAYYNVDLRPFKKDPIQNDKIIPYAGFWMWDTSFRCIKMIQNSFIVELFTRTKVNEQNEGLTALWNPAKGNKIIPTFLPPRFTDQVSTNSYNTKYLLWSAIPHGCLIDTSKSCHHYCNLIKKGYKWERENFSTTCENDKCAIIDTWSDFYWFPFLSAEDPDLLVGIKAKKEGFDLVISRIGQQQKTEVNLTKVVIDPDDVKLGSEHVIRSRTKKIMKHWFSFEINNELYFIDLLDPTRKVKTAVVPRYEWIPNESKVVLQNKNILIVFDLETVSRCSKLTFRPEVQDFSILPNRGFIAVLENNGKNVTICQWETAMKARSIDVTEYDISNIMLASTNILLLWNETHLYYIQLYPTNQPSASVN